MATASGATRFRAVYKRLSELRALLYPLVERSLKPGGMIGIEQHRAKPNAPYSFTDGSKGYLREKDVIAIMEIHGFDYVGSSKANANPKDPADWPNGVWTLPPALRDAKEEDKARLTAIGESDRMTLLFRKRL